jgi:hypothetical protein
VVHRKVLHLRQILTLLADNRLAGKKEQAIDKLQLSGQNLCRVFDFRFGHLHAENFGWYQVKLPNLKLKTPPKPLLGSLPLVSGFPEQAL